MRPLSLLLGFFLRFVLSDLLWGCEPTCSSYTGTRPQIAKSVVHNDSWFVAGSNGEPQSVPVGELVNQLVTTSGKYGLVILESGSDFAVQWLLSSQSQTVGISGLTSSSTPSTKFTELATRIYAIDSKNYNITPKGVVIVSPSSSISFKLISSQGSALDCAQDGLVFAIVPWDTVPQSQLSRDVNFIVPGQCSFCPSLPLSDKYIRICPTSAAEGETQTRETLPTRSPTTVTTTDPTTPAKTSTTERTTVTTPTKTSTTHSTSTSKQTTPSTPSPTTSVTTTTATSTTSPVTTTTPTTAAPPTVFQASLRSDLKGIRIRYDAAPLGFLDCTSLLQDLSLLGKQVACSGDGKGVDVTFGPEAIVKPGDLLKLHFKEGVVAVTVANSTTMIRPDFVVEYRKVVMSCEQSIEFNVKQVAGTGDRAATYQWNLVDGPTLVAAALQEARDKRTVSLPTKLVQSNLTINLTVCNFAGQCSTSGPLTVQVVNSTQSLTLSIEGIPPVVYPSMTVKLTAIPRFSSCNDVNDARETLYNWTVNGTNSFDAVLRIPSYTHTVDDVVPIFLQASYMDPKSGQLFAAESQAQIQYSSEPIIVTVDSARRIHPADAVLFIDASASRDPNSPGYNLGHTWSCTNLSSNLSCILPKGINFNAAYMELPAGTLEEGGEFLFVDNVTGSLGQTGIVSSQVTVTAALLPSVTVVPMVYPKQSVHEYIRILALISSDQSPTNVTWEVVKSPGYDYFVLTDFLPESKIRFNIDSNGRKVLVSLTIPPKSANWTGLTANSFYLLRISATNSQGTSSSEVVLQTQAELPQGLVEVSPLEDLTGLSTDITFRLGDGWNSLDFPVSYRFGYRVLFTNNETTIEWLQLTTGTSVNIILPSAGPNTTACTKRAGFTAVVEACDRVGACRVTESAPFYLNSPANLTVAINEVVTKINADIVNGDILSSMQKIWAVEMELCQSDIDSTVADRSTLALLHSLSSESDLEEWKDAVEAASQVLPSVSDNVLEEIQPILQSFREKLGFDTVSRQKRDTSMVALANNTATSEKEASDMLDMYDVLLSRNQKVVDVYLANIDDFLAGFCLQLDEQSTRILKAQGSYYTEIQAQAVDPNNDNFLNTTVTTAGGTVPIKFTYNFKTLFTSWSCGSNILCRFACLASARILSTAFDASSQLVDRFYSDKSPVDANRSVSDLYKVSILDPITGKLAGQLMAYTQLYSIRIPITGYKATNYYACYIYTDISSLWDGTSCTTTSYAYKTAGTYHVTCNCTTSGIIGIFTVSPPPPPPDIPLYNEIFITFTLNSSQAASAAQQLTCMTNIGSQSGQTSRLVGWKFSMNNDSLVQATVSLRPPYKTTQLPTASAVQAIQRVVDPLSGFVAYDPVKVLSTSYAVIKRTLSDANARKVIVRIEKTYSQVVGNTTDLATKWTGTIADALRISTYRFKNAAIFMGIIFNFTITRPFEGEAVGLTAEEISLMLIEATSYGELQVQSATGESIILPPLQLSTDIVQLLVIQQTNSLVVVLLVGIFSGVMIASLYIGGAIVVKVRTDRCLEEERRRVVLRDTGEISAPPRYDDVPEGVVRSRHR